MKKIGVLILILTAFLALPSFAQNSTKAPAMPADALTLQSPDGQLQLKFAVVNGQPQYALDRGGKPVVLPSRMGFTLEWRDDLAHASSSRTSPTALSMKLGIPCGVRRRTSATTTTKCW